MGSILLLYLIGTFAAALVAVVASFMFPLTIQLKVEAQTLRAPGGIVAVLSNLLMSVVDNPINTLANANYISILVWAIAMGLAMLPVHASPPQIIFLL